MYITDKTDELFLKRLWNSRVDDEKKMNSGKLDDSCSFGIFFDSLFEDINETLCFRRRDNVIDVLINHKEMPYWGPVPSEDWAYGDTSERNKLKIEIIERVQLLRQLEDHRLAVWSYDGRVSSESKHSSTYNIISFGGNENAKYLMQHINETFAPTNHLKNFIDNGFMDNDEKRNRKLLRQSAITTGAAILTLLISVITMIFSSNINTLKRNENDLILKTAEMSHYNAN